MVGETHSYRYTDVALFSFELGACLSTLLNYWKWETIFESIVAALHTYVNKWQAWEVFWRQQDCQECKIISASLLSPNKASILTTEWQLFLQCEHRKCLPSTNNVLLIQNLHGKYSFLICVTCIHFHLTFLFNTCILLRSRCTSVLLMHIFNYH